METLTFNDMLNKKAICSKCSYCALTNMYQKHDTNINILNIKYHIFNSD